MGKRIRQLTHKNEGSTLILVLICMTFLGLLGSVILTATVSNMKMKTVDALAKDNFYTTESAVDELKVGLEEEAQNRMKEAYSYMLQRYSTTPDAERTTLLMRRFVTLFYNDLAITDYNPIMPYEPSEVDEDMLKDKYLKSPTGQQADIVSGSGIKVKLDLVDLSVTLLGVSIRYTDTSGYESTITTDIKFSATYPSLSTRNISNAGVYYSDYALIADKTIEKEGADATIVDGNIYGGLGILARDENTILTLKSNKVISREELEAINKAKIVIPAKEQNSVLINSVWVNDIATKCDPGASGLRDYLEITANCYVQDDLTLGANYGRVKIAGNYYGYQITNANVSNPSGTAAGSSSVSINARNAVLDFSEVKSLWIAGKSYLSVPSVYASTSPVTVAETQVLEGESISFKGDQVAYLVPGNCIVGIGHNPMTYAEYEKIGTSEDYKVDITLNGVNGGIKLENYVNSSSTNSFTAHHVRYLHDNDTMQMVYLYLNFQSADLASDYFYEYQRINLNKEKLKSFAKSLELGNVILPTSPDTFVNTGTILTYDSTNPTNPLNYTNRRKHFASGDVTISSNATELQRKQAEYSTQYKGLITCLNENYRATGQSASLVKNLVRYDDDNVKHIQGIINASIAMHNNPVTNTYDIYRKIEGDTYILVTGSPDPVLISSSNKKGLIIATGDVIVQGCEFTGLIITTGKIILKAGANVNAAPEYVKNIIDTTPEVNQFLYDYTASGTGSSGDSNTIQINYENWYKE